MTRSNRLPVLILWALLLLLELGCRESTNLPGTIWVEASPERTLPLIKLEFAHHGRGSWIKGEERTGFKWESKDKQIWLHSPSGGVVTGRFVTSDRIEITIPGAGLISFNKTERGGSN